MQCPYRNMSCNMVDTSGMDKIPCSECEVYKEAKEEDDDEGQDVRE